MQLPGKVTRLFTSFLIVLVLLGMNNKIQAQNYPPYTITAFDSSSSGYYFVCPIKVGANPNGVVPTHMILDKEGDVIYYKPFQNILNTGDFKVNQNGMMTFSLDGKYYVQDSTFTVIDSVSVPGGYLFDGHDIQLLPNGHILLLAEEVVQMDLSSYLLFGPNHTNPGSTSANVKSGIVLELDQNKNIIFEWHAKDHCSFTDIDVSFCNNPNNVDWTHYNAIEMDDDGNLLVSSRHFSEVTKINKSTGAIMWRLGGNANQFNFVNDPFMFKRQHDIRKLPNGNYSLFDNGDGNVSFPFHAAYGKEYELDVNLLTANLVWSYMYNPSINSQAMGSMGRNPGGISILGYGILGQDSKIFTAVNDAGAKVLEIAFDDTLWSYRSFHYDTLPWNLNRPVITCFYDNGQYFLDAGAGFSNYLWSDGSTSQTIPVTATGEYSVFVPKGDGGFICSEKLRVTDPLDPCGTVSINEMEANNRMQIFPNPVQDFVTLEFQNEVSGELKIQDLTGKTLLLFNISKSNSVTLTTSQLAAGIYFVNLNGKVKKLVKM